MEKPGEYSRGHLTPPGARIHSHRLHWNHLATTSSPVLHPFPTCCAAFGMGQEAKYRSSWRLDVCKYTVSVARETFPVTKNCAFDSMEPSGFLVMVWPKFLLCIQGQYTQHHSRFRYSAWHSVYSAFTVSGHTSWEWLQLGHIVYSLSEQRWFLCLHSIVLLPYVFAFLPGKSVKKGLSFVSPPQHFPLMCSIS